MRIELSKEQYKDLIDLVIAGNWLINSWRENDEIIKKYEDLEQHIFSFSSRFEMEQEVEYDEELKQYYPTKEFEDEVLAYVDEYDDETFWDELTGRMAEKEALIKYKDPTIEQKWKLESKYEKEFEENGLERLDIDWKKNRDVK